VGEQFAGVARLTPEGQWTRVIGGRTAALAGDRGSIQAPLMPGRVPLDTAFRMLVGRLALHGRELIMVTDTGIEAFHLDSRRLARVLPFDPRLKANRMGPIPFLNPHLPADRCAVIAKCGPLALTPEGLCLVEMGRGLAELELPDGPITTVMDPPEVERKNHFVSRIPAGDTEKDHFVMRSPGAGGAAPPAAADNLWPGEALQTLTVQADGQCGVTHWRSAAPGQRFSGQCRVAARDFAAGLVQIGLEFTNGDGKVLAHLPAVESKLPDGVAAPVPDGTLLHVSGTVPAGADRVGLRIRVLGGNPGAAVSFDDVTFHRLP